MDTDTPDRVRETPGDGRTGETGPDNSHDAVTKRATDLIGDIANGRVIRPQRKLIAEALDKAASGDKVNDAIGRSTRR